MYRWLYCRMHRRKIPNTAWYTSRATDRWLKRYSWLLLVEIVILMDLIIISQLTVGVVIL